MIQYRQTDRQTAQSPNREPWPVRWPQIGVSRLGGTTEGILWQKESCGRRNLAVPPNRRQRHRKRNIAANGLSAKRTLQQNKHIKTNIAQNERCGKANTCSKTNISPRCHTIHSPQSAPAPYIGAHEFPLRLPLFLPSSQAVSHSPHGTSPGLGAERQRERVHFSSIPHTRRNV